MLYIHVMHLYPPPQGEDSQYNNLDLILRALPIPTQAFGGGDDNVTLILLYTNVLVLKLVVELVPLFVIVE